jgi:hypothetical protein
LKTYPLPPDFPQSSSNASVLPPTGWRAKSPRPGTKSSALDAGASRRASPRLLPSTRSDTPRCTSDISATEPAVRPSLHIRSYLATTYVVAAGPSGPCSNSSSLLRASSRHAKRKPAFVHCCISWRTCHTPDKVEYLRILVARQRHDIAHRAGYSSWRRHHMPVSLRPLGARSSHTYVPQRASSPRA